MPKTSLHHLYALALGSNRPLSAKRPPASLLREAIGGIAALGTIFATAPVIPTAPLGPSLRRFANGAVLLESSLNPSEMLSALQQIEDRLGRRRHRRWGARSIDIDIILWTGGRWDSRTLHIPHPAFRSRDFVLLPLLTIAPKWRDPVSGLSIRHLDARLRKATPLLRPRG
jgi:2-amino-4-hydroxy-6-hydroxymethyldihydropteridine diphosphokinase